MASPAVWLWLRPNKRNDFVSPTGDKTSIFRQVHRVCVLITLRRAVPPKRIFLMKFDILTCYLALTDWYMLTLTLSFVGLKIYSGYFPPLTFFLIHETLLLSPPSIVHYMQKIKTRRLVSGVISLRSMVSNSRQHSCQTFSSPPWNSRMVTRIVKYHHRSLHRRGGNFSFGWTISLSQAWASLSLCYITVDNYSSVIITSAALSSAGNADLFTHFSFWPC